MGDVSGFQWDRKNLPKVKAHGVTPEEAQQVLRNDPLHLHSQNVEGEERVLALGETDKGRLLNVAFTERGDVTRVITAYPAKASFKRLYLRHSGGLR